MAKTQTLLWLILWLCSFTVEAVSIVQAINYRGNSVTQSSVMNREIYISPGDAFDEALIEKSRQAIMDLGLFKSVYYFLDEDYSSTDTESGDSRITVVFVVKEKYFFLVIPRLKLEDDEFYYGLQLKADNVFGLNHQLRLLAEDRGTTQGVDESRYLFRYFYTNVNDSYYNLNVDLQTQNDVDETEGAVNRQDDSYRIGITRWLNEKGRNRGWFAGSSVAYQLRFNEDLLVSSDSQSIDAVILGFNFGYRNINNFEYNRGGKDYGYRLDVSDEMLGSEAEYTRHLFYYRSYYQFKDQPLSNINVQMQFGHANNKVLGEYAFSLGSNDDLRGYENNRFLGNTLLLTNLEYMFPQKSYPLLRYVTFIDVGNTYDQLSDVLHMPLNVGAGVGMRWKIRSFVKVDLRADVGYGFSDEDYKFSFGTRHAF